jgi:outer membrane protein|tara:strand:+ start:64 stop:576 length:513 start_codon:yes stop_codon:yes gene_type:complete
MILNRILITVFTLFFGLTLLAQKFAFVDSEYILDQMESYQKAQKQIDDLSEKWQKEIKAKNELLEQKKNDLKKNEILLPEETKREREQEIQDLSLEIRAFQSKKFGVGGDLFKKRKELIQPIQRKIYKAIESLAEDNNYSFVLDKSKHSNILFADPKYDKSDDIIRKLKK